MVLVHLDTAPLIAEIKDVRETIEERFARGFAEAGRMVVDLFRHEWLSGREADGLGLNIVTGRLFQSIRTVTTVRGNSLLSEVFNTGAPYWWYHENPEGGRHKYLYLQEAYLEDGGKLYESQIEQALGMVA